METTDRTRGLRLFLALMFCGVATLYLANTITIDRVASQELRTITIDRVANQEHANTKHLEAPLIRNRHKRGLCYEKQAYISAQRGTLLVLCKLDNQPTVQAMWGGLIWRVLEHRHGSATLLSPDQLYECTVFGNDWLYWKRVIVRDGYVKALDTEWHKPLRWLISP